jgi:hypothetical protein
MSKPDPREPFLEDEELEDEGEKEEDLDIDYNEIKEEEA